MNIKEANQCLADLKNQVDKLKNLKFTVSNGETPSAVVVYVDDMQRMANSIYDSMYSAINHCHSRINDLEEDIYKWRYDHLKGHLPNAKTPTQMTKCLEVLGMEDDFEVAKNYISVAKTRQGIVATASYNNESTKI